MTMRSRALTLGKNRWPSVVILLAVALAAASGCGDGRLKRARVTGVVIYHSKPVEGAGVTFYPHDGAIASGVTDANGRFTLTTFARKGNDGALLGEHVVTVSKYVPDPKDPRPEPLKARIPVLPPAYSSLVKSPLRAKVTAEGPNDFRLELVD
jgi:hypothetical protein